MYALEISYRRAIDGVYNKATPISDPFGQYFHQMGATVCHHTIRIRDLEFTDDHLINITNLIYYVKKEGYNSLSLLLDDDDSYSVIKNRIYSISSLPEVNAKIHESKNGQKILLVSYKENDDSLINAESDGLSYDDFEKIVDEVLKEFDDISKGKDTDSAMPDEIIRKYKTAQSSEDKEKAKMKLTNPYEKIAAIIKGLDKS